MENVKPSPSKTAFKWALIYFITSIILTYAFQFLDMSQNVIAKSVGYIPFIAFLLLAQKEYKDQMGGYAKFGEVFMPGFLYSVFAGLMLAVFIFVYLKFLSPQILEQSVAAQKDALVAKGLSDDQIETTMDLTRKYGALFGAIGVAFITPIIGAIIALIGAAIFKKERSAFDLEPTDPAV